jgi:hypothetical protein
VASSELLITTVPGRTGLYLAFREDDNFVRPIARFSRGAESAEQFMSWAERAGIRCERDPEKTKEG